MGCYLVGDCIRRNAETIYGDTHCLTVVCNVRSLLLFTMQRLDGAECKIRGMTLVTPGGVFIAADRNEFMAHCRNMTDEDWDRFWDEGDNEMELSSIQEDTICYCAQCRDHRMETGCICCSGGCCRDNPICL